MKLSVIYHSESGKTRRMAEIIAKGMNSVEGAEARAFSIDELDAAFAAESRCVVFGAPIYGAYISGKMADFLMKGTRQINLAGKLAGAFTTARYVHGGGDLGVREILDRCMVAGALTYSGGAACGLPMIHLGPVAISDTMPIEQFDDTFEVYGKRMVQKALELFGE